MTAHFRNSGSWPGGAATLILALAGLALAAPGRAQDHAKDFTAGTVKISGPWTRVTPPAAKVAGGFMTLTNTGTTSDRLLGGTASVSGRLEVHEMSLDGGIMRMRALPEGLEIKPGQSVELKPGSFHIMLLDLKAPITADTTVKGTLVFEKAGTVEIAYKVEPLGAKGQAGSGHQNHGK